MQFLNENEQEQSGIGMDEERERRVLHADNLEQLALLFGSLDENIETVAQRTGARIGSVGTEITVTGTREQADLACTVLEKLIAMLRRNEKIDKSRINYAVELAKEGNGRHDRRDHAGRDRHHRPRPPGALQNARPAQLRQGRQGKRRHLRRRACGHRQDLSWPWPWRWSRSKTRRSSASS